MRFVFWQKLGQTTVLTYTYVSKHLFEYHKLIPTVPLVPVQIL
jgi:hypothetical protein